MGRSRQNSPERGGGSPQREGSPQRGGGSSPQRGGSPQRQQSPRDNQSYPDYSPPDNQPFPDYSPPAQQSFPDYSPPAQQPFPDYSPPVQQSFPDNPPPAQQPFPDYSPPNNQSFPDYSPPAQQPFPDYSPPAQNVPDYSPPVVSNEQMPPPTSGDCYGPIETTVNIAPPPVVNQPVSNNNNRPNQPKQPTPAPAPQRPQQPPPVVRPAVVHQKWPNNQVHPTNTNINITISQPNPPPPQVVYQQQYQPRPQPPVVQPVVIQAPPTNIAMMYPDDFDSNASRYKLPQAPLVIQGLPPAYGQVSWGSKRVVPAPQMRFDVANAPDSTPSLSGSMLNMDQDTAKDLLIRYSMSNCCFGKNPAKEATITSIVPSTALHYTLETFTQKRSLEYAYVPYKGEPLDNYQMGAIPDPWSIACNPNSNFTSSTTRLKVPHTEQLMTCFRCNGQGNLRCSSCGGRGRSQCTSCHGSGRTETIVNGHPQRVACSWCGGSGQRNCTRCSGRGFTRCGTCNGSCRLKVYLELEVAFINHKNEYINELTDLPDNLIRSVSGEPILNQSAPLLVPITNFDQKDVVANSVNLFNQHRNFFGTEWPMMQRQILELVPVIECGYEWKEFHGRFWIFGREQHVYCDDYPQSCCGCCCCCGGCCECCKCCNCSIQ